MLDRKTTKLGDKTAGQVAEGIIYIDIDIYSPPPSSHLHRPGAYGYPSCSSPSVRSDQGARSRRSPHRENAENLWAPGQWVAGYWNTVQIWEWEFLGLAFFVDPIQVKTHPLPLFRT